MKKSFTTLLRLLSIVAFAQSKNEILRKSKSAKSNTAPNYKFNLCDSSIVYSFLQMNFNLRPEYKYNFSYNNKDLVLVKKSFKYNPLSLIWDNESIDSFFYDSNNRLSYRLQYLWSTTKLKFYKYNVEYLTFDNTDKIVNDIVYFVDTLGNINYCAYRVRNTNYYPSKLSESNIDSMYVLCLNHTLEGRDSVVYNLNRTIKEIYWSKEYYGFYTGNTNTIPIADKSIFNYNGNAELTSIITLGISSQTFNWDTLYGEFYTKKANCTVDYLKYWDTWSQTWVNSNSDSVFNYNPILDRFNNSISQVREVWITGVLNSYDSTHYYYHIPSCLSYYTTKYDTFANTFNLTIDSASIAQAIGYSWDFGDGTTSNLQFPSHHFAFDTTYNVCLKIYKSNGDSCTYCHLIGKDYQGHIIKSAGFNLNVKGNGNIGINESSNSKNEIIIYPNPASQSIVISNKPALSQREGSLVNTIEITNVLGQIVLAVAPSPLVVNPDSVGERAGVRSINIETLPNGIYFLKATDEKGNEMNAKFVKE